MRLIILSLKLLIIGICVNIFKKSFDFSVNQCFERGNPLSGKFVRFLSVVYTFFCITFRRNEKNLVSEFLKNK